jgi:hypothetical protein
MIFGIALFTVTTVLACIQQRYDSGSDFKASPINGGKEVEITEYVGNKFEVRIPKKIQNLPVTSIGSGAFAEKNVASVSIPNGVTSIEEAFQSCTSLASVSIPNSVTNIAGAFSGCTSLASVSIPNDVTNIAGAFSGCTSLASVSIPNNVTSIGDWAFYDCSSLTSITIPNGVTSIGNGAFVGSGLTSITIPNSVISIGDWAFENCSGLTSVTIPNSVTSIGDGAFSGSGLTSITIPNSVIEIGNYAFSDCSNLTSVTIGANVDSYFGDYDFLNAYYNNGKRAGTYTRPNTSSERWAYSGTSSGTSVTQTPSVTPQNDFQATHKVVTNDGSTLRLRNAPGFNASQIGSLNYGSHVMVLSTGEATVDSDGNRGNWTYVRTPDGTTGWCFGAYLQKL